MYEHIQACARMLASFIFNVWLEKHSLHGGPRPCASPSLFLTTLIHSSPQRLRSSLPMSMAFFLFLVGTSSLSCHFTFAHLVHGRMIAISHHAVHSQHDHRVSIVSTLSTEHPTKTNVQGQRHRSPETGGPGCTTASPASRQRTETRHEPMV